MSRSGILFVFTCWIPTRMIDGGYTVGTYPKRFSILVGELSLHRRVNTTYKIYSRLIKVKLHSESLCT